eukprot:2124648-Rhodomonas_salina.1
MHLNARYPHAHELHTSGSADEGRWTGEGESAGRAGRLSKSLSVSNFSPEQLDVILNDKVRRPMALESRVWCLGVYCWGSRV